jgi:L-malate glycosyltransferase
MNILFVSQSFYPYIGGVTTHLLNLAEQLIKRGHHVTIVTMRIGNIAKREVVEKIYIHRVKINKKVLNNYSTYKEILYKACHGISDNFTKAKLNREGLEAFEAVSQKISIQIKGLLKKGHFDLIHVYDFQLLSLYKYLPNDLPLILTWCIPFEISLPYHIERFIIGRMAHYDKVIFLTNKFKMAAIQKGLSEKKAEAIFPATDTEYYRPVKAKAKFRNKYGINDNSKVILCVQRCDAKSGHLQLVRAMPEVLRKIPQAKLIFVCGKSLSEKISQERDHYRNNLLELVEKLRLTNQIIFIEALGKTQLLEIYNLSDIVVLASKSEGFGLSVTEAMACSKPIIGTNVGGIAEQIQDGINGYLIGVGDIEQTSDKIVHLLSNIYLRKQMGKSGLQIVKEKFCINNISLRHQNLYQALLQK